MIAARHSLTATASTWIDVPLFQRARDKRAFHARHPHFDKDSDETDEKAVGDDTATEAEPEPDFGW